VVRVLLPVSVFLEQVARVVVKPAGIIVEIELDRQTGRHTGAILLTRRHAIGWVVADTEDRHLVDEL